MFGSETLGTGRSAVGHLNKLLCAILATQIRLISHLHLCVHALAARADFELPWWASRGPAVWAAAGISSWRAFSGPSWRPVRSARWPPACTTQAGGPGGLCAPRRTELQSNPQFRFNSIFCSSGRKAPPQAWTALANHVTHRPCESQGTTRARFRSHTPIATFFLLPTMATLRKGYRGGERCADVVLRCLSSRQVVVQVWGASTWSQCAQNAKTRSLRGSASTDEGANALGDTNEG